MAINEMPFGSRQPLQELEPEGIAIITKPILQDCAGIALAGVCIVGEVVNCLLAGSGHGSSPFLQTALL